MQLNFPEEFNIDIYKSNNIIFNKMTNKEIITHYNYYGIHEGLICNEIKNRHDFFDLINNINQKIKILEIGPLHNPIFSREKFECKYLDYFTTDELKKNYKNDNNVNIENIPTIDYVVKDINSYTEIIKERFDIIFSSHNIEHVPCVITFLNNLSSVLHNDGYIMLCIPDYKYCFDFYRNPTTIFDILNNYYNKINKPPTLSILESKYYMTHNNSNEHWDKRITYYHNYFNMINTQKEFEKSISSKIINDIQEIEKIYLNYDYIDTHVWKFDYDNFKNIINILYEAKLINLKIHRIYNTKKNSNEFYAVLQK